MLKCTRVFLILLVIAAGLVCAASANAGTEVLNFVGLNATAEEAVDNYYNGGLGSDGSGPGPNYGIVFSSNAITANSNNGTPAGCCNVNEVPGGTGANALFFLTGSSDIMNIAAGFTNGFSFDYSSVNEVGSVEVYSGLNGTGTLLATLGLSLTPTNGNGGCGTDDFCPFEPVGVTFAGTAESVSFAGTENQIAFADITLGSSTPGGTTVPEPASLAMVVTALAGFGLIRRRRRM